MRREPRLSHDFYQRPRCSVCRLGREGAVDLPRIEKLLADGARLKPVGEKFGVPWCALWRHWLGVTPERKNYLKFGSEQSDSRLQSLAAIRAAKPSARPAGPAIYLGLHFSNPIHDCREERFDFRRGDVQAR
jgi:hypothetical protein